MQHQQLTACDSFDSGCSVRFHLFKYLASHHPTRRSMFALRRCLESLLSEESTLLQSEHFCIAHDHLQYAHLHEVDCVSFFALLHDQCRW